MNDFYNYAMNSSFVKFAVMAIAIISIIYEIYIFLTLDITAIYTTYPVVVLCVWLMYFLALRTVYVRTLTNRNLKLIREEIRELPQEKQEKVMELIDAILNEVGP